MNDGGALEDVLQAAADPADDEHHDLGGREPVEHEVAVDEFGKAPAVDELENDAQIVVDAVEVEDAADVLVIQDRVTARLLYEKGDQGGVAGVEKLLDDHRTFETRLAGQAGAIDTAHAARAQFLLEDILAWHGSRVPLRTFYARDRPYTAPAFKTPMRIMALDIGDRTIGVACSDEGLILASPVETIQRRGPKADSIRVDALVKERGVARVIAGLPLTLRGEAGPQSAKVNDFVEVLRRRLKVPVEMFDERLTTREAERTLIANDMSRARRKGIIDQMAAVLILQTWLDARANAQAGPPS